MLKEVVHILQTHTHRVSTLATRYLWLGRWLLCWWFAHLASSHNDAISGFYHVLEEILQLFLLVFSSNTQLEHTHTPSSNWAFMAEK